MGFFQDMSTPMEGLKAETWHFGNENSGRSEDQDRSRDQVDAVNGLQSRLCARGHWRPVEDAKLRELVAQHGPQNWNLIAEKLDGRSGKSCRLRWFNQLDPRISRRAFSQEEEEKLLAAHRAYGNKWAMIARLFPGRTDNAMKNHWHVIMARKQREQQSTTAAYRRRKPPPSSTSTTSSASNSPHGLQTMANVNACSGDQSTITSTRDESVSTSTELSLNCNCPFTSHAKRPPPSFDLFMGTQKKILAAGNGDFATPLVVVQGAFSDTNSEVNGGLFQAKEDYGRERGKMEMPFFDFLGVGAT